MFLFVAPFRVEADEEGADGLRAWIAGGFAAGLADSGQTRFSLWAGGTRQVARRLGLGLGAGLAGTYHNSDLGGSHGIRLYTVFSRLELSPWQRGNGTVFLTGDAGYAWWVETWTIGTELGATYDTQRGLHVAGGVGARYRKPEEPFGVQLHLSLHPDVGPDLGSPFLNCAFGVEW